MKTLIWVAAIAVIAILLVIAIMFLWPNQQEFISVEGTRISISCVDTEWLILCPIRDYWSDHRKIYRNIERIASLSITYKFFLLIDSNIDHCFGHECRIKTTSVLGDTILYKMLRFIKSYKCNYKFLHKIDHDSYVNFTLVDREIRQSNGTNRIFGQVIKHGYVNGGYYILDRAAVNNIVFLETIPSNVPEDLYINSFVGNKVDFSKSGNKKRYQGENYIDKYSDDLVHWHYIKYDEIF